MRGSKKLTKQTQGRTFPSFLSDNQIGTPSNSLRKRIGDPICKHGRRPHKLAFETINKVGLRRQNEASSRFTDGRKLNRNLRLYKVERKSYFVKFVC